jgi:hypothetical protein
VLAAERGQPGGVLVGDKHINMLGRYAFAPPAGPELRPLRDPASPDNDQ